MTGASSDALGKQLSVELEKNLFLANTPKFEIFDWKPLCPEEKCRAFANAVYDIDFVAVTGPLELVLNDEDFIELIGNSSGKICQLSSLQNVRSRNFGRMLLYAKLGDWLVGEPLTREVLEEVEAVDFNGETAENCPTSNSTQVATLNFRS